MIDGPGESKGEGDAEHAAHRIGSRPSAEIEGCTERTGRSASPCASLADSTRGMPRNRDGRPAMKAEPPNSESADGSDDSAIHQRKGLPTSQVPLAVNERAKRLTKSQPSRVTSSRRSTAIIVNYSDLRWAKGGLFDTEPGGKTRNSRRGGETRHHSRLTCERSEPITLELAAADLGSDSEDFPPATGIDPNRINLLIDSHEGLGTHVKTNQKVQAEGGIAVLVTQLGSNFDETGIEGWLTFGIKHLNTLPIRRVRAWCEWVWSFTMPSRWHIAPAIATRLQDRRRIRVRGSVGSSRLGKNQHNGGKTKEGGNEQKGEKNHEQARCSIPEGMQRDHSMVEELTDKENDDPQANSKVKIDPIEPPSNAIKTGCTNGPTHRQ